MIAWGKLVYPRRWTIRRLRIKQRWVVVIVVKRRGHARAAMTNWAHICRSEKNDEAKNAGRVLAFG